MSKTAEMEQVSRTTGLVLHGAAQYDLLLWLLTLGRESTLRKRALGFARLSPGERVLDIGCGTGTLAIAAKQQVGTTGRVCGVDAAAEMIARANHKATKAAMNIDFRIGFVESLPFPDGQFDVVLSTLMLHHLPDKLRSQCAGEIRRVLRPGGRILAVDFGTSPSQGKGIVAHFHRHGHISLDEIVAMLSDVGLKIEESGSIGISDLKYVLAAAPCVE